MLRSEVDWFPRFIAYCQYYVPTMPEDEEGSLIQDKSTLKRVSVCDGWREVQTILDEYRETAFSDLVYMIRICAKLPPSMVVSTSNVLPLQTVSRILERTGLTGHGHECGGRSHMGR